MQNFENFIVDDSNQEAYEAVLKISAEVKDTPGFLYIYGAVGVGKTHLLKAVKDKVERETYLNVELVEGAQVVDQFIAIFKGSIHTEYPVKELYPIYADVDVLLIENVECLVGKESTQSLVGELVCTLLENGKTVMFTTGKQMEREALKHFAMVLEEKKHICTDVYIDIPTLNLKRRFADRVLKELKIQLTETEEQKIIKGAMNCREINAILKQVKFYQSLNPNHSNTEILDKVLLQRGKNEV